ncbi:VWA domain-containing protein [Candidatus Dependentiae bacterium]|nr:VWA domain-containing protein [Candidatus Dependentiae bacterium]
MDFLYPEYLYFFIGIPILILLYYLSVKYGEELKNQFSSRELSKKLEIPGNERVPRANLIFLILSLIFMILAIARPLGDVKYHEKEMVGADIIICFDISQSMLVRDVKPNRLEMGKEVLRKVVKGLGGDRVGIILFSERPIIFCPPTSDYNALLSFIDEIDFDSLEGGTKLSEALVVADKILNRKKEIPSAGKAILIISDGEDQGSNPESISKKLKSKGIKVISIGVGTRTGGRIPVPIQSFSDSLFEDPFFKSNKIKRGKFEYKKYKGRMVISRLEPEALQEVSKITNGKYIELKKNYKTNEILTEINDLKKFKGKSKKFQDREEMFQYFLFPAVLFLIIHLIIPEEWRRKKSYQFKK